MVQHEDAHRAAPQQVRSARRVTDPPMAQPRPNAATKPPIAHTT